jgi:hypothetical protein
MPFCTKCGAENSVDGEFCYKCGTALFSRRPGPVGESGAAVAVSIPPAVSSNAPSGIGGWLLLLVLQLFSGGVAVGIVGFTVLYASFRVSREPNLGLCLYGFVALLFGGTGILAGVQLVRKKKHGVLMAKVYVSIFGCFALLVAFVASNMTPPHQSLIGSAVQGVAISALWFVYLLRSRRVKNTYQLAGGMSGRVYV